MAGRRGSVGHRTRPPLPEQIPEGCPRADFAALSEGISELAVPGVCRVALLIAVAPAMAREACAKGRVMDLGSGNEARQGRTRIVFMGTPEFAAVVLEGLLADGWNVVGAVTQPDRPRGRGRKVAPTPVSRVAQGRGILVLQPKKIKDKVFFEDLADLRPDMLVVAAFGRILPPEVLSLPPLGCYNVHASLLPAYRGPAPVRWAIINGERTTGVTIFRMDEGMDTGDLIAAESLEIDADETAGMLTDRLAGLAARMITPTLRQVAEGTARFVPQDHGKATVIPILRKEDGLIDWSLNAEAIRNRIRGLDPWPGAFTFWQGKRLRLWEADVREGNGAALPGEILSAGVEGVSVQTAGGVLRLKSVQLEGGRRMSAEEFLRGHKMVPGERLG